MVVCLRKKVGEGAGIGWLKPEHTAWLETRWFFGGIASSFMKIVGP